MARDLPPGIHRYKHGFRAQVSYVDADGVRRRPSRYVVAPDTIHGRRLAELARAELIATYLVDGPPEDRPDPGTVAELLDQWQVSRAPHVTQNTRDSYRHAARRVTDRIGAMPAGKVRPADLDRLYAELLAAGGPDGGPLSPATVRHSHAALAAAYRFAARRGDLNPAQDPTVGATQPPRRARPIEPPSPDVVRMLLDTTTLPLWRPLILRLAVTTGARRGELLGIRWSDVDLEAGTVRRPRIVSATSKGTEVKASSKTGRMLPRVTVDTSRVDSVGDARPIGIHRATVCAVKICQASPLGPFPVFGYQAPACNYKRRTSASPCNLRVGMLGAI